MRGGQKPAGVAPRRAIAFLIKRTRLSWYMTFTLCPSLSSCLGQKCCSPRRGSHLVTVRKGTCSGMVVEQGLGFLVINSSSSSTSLGLLLDLDFVSCEINKTLIWQNHSTWMSLSCTDRYLCHKVAVKIKMTRREIVQFTIRVTIFREMF